MNTLPTAHITHNCVDRTIYMDKGYIQIIVLWMRPAIEGT